MDRSQNLRALMKENKRSADTLLENKEKIKILKQMRLKSNENSSANESFTNSTKLSSKAVVAPVTAPPVTQTVHSCLESRVVPTSTTDPRHNLTQSITGARMKPNNPSSSSAAASSQLPEGFFDDPFKDSYARGLDPVKILREDKEAQEKDLSSFFSDIKDLDHLEVMAEQADEQTRLQEDQALQMSYELKLARLYEKASHVVSKLSEATTTSSSLSDGNNEARSIKTLEDESQEILKVFVPLNADAENAGNSIIPQSGENRQHLLQVTVGNSAEDSIERIMLNKRLERVRNRHNRRHLMRQESILHTAGDDNEDVDEEVYVPPDYSDWTSRSI